MDLTVRLGCWNDGTDAGECGPDAESRIVYAHPRDPEDFTAAMDMNPEATRTGDNPPAWKVHDLQAARGQLLMLYRMRMCREDHSLRSLPAGSAFALALADFGRQSG